MDEDLYHPTFNLGAFRYAAARYVKLLVRARWKCKPGFLTKETLKQWELDDIENDSYPSWRLLTDAAAALANLNSEFLPRCGSGGVRLADETTPEGRLIGALAFLADVESGGPYHNAAILRAATKLQKKQSIDWKSLVRWESLSQIREDLDKLPHPSHDPRDPSKLRAEYLGEGRYRIGEALLSLDETFAFVLEALVEKRSATAKVLARACGNKNAPRILRKIHERFDLLAPFISLPGSKGRGGYSTSIVDTRPKSPVSKAPQ